ncbi:hypothetical protein BEUL_0800 [Bifidobacterium eulemuris]|nr:hypothetical protein BEUL_0800 [Bifidobacterium eulemuris]
MAAEKLKFCIVRVPYPNPYSPDKDGAPSNSEEYREVFEYEIDHDRDAWIAPKTKLEEVTAELTQAKRRLFTWPTVYIVWFKSKASDDDQRRDKWCVYVGETQHIHERTMQHVQASSKDNWTITDDEVLSNVESVTQKIVKSRLAEEQQADDCINEALRDQRKVNQYVIWESHFNKSLTLDVENKLIDYMKSIDDIHCLNGRGNPQDQYFTSAYLDDIVSGAWKRLVSADKEGIFPPEEQIWQSSLYKVSPFHKLGKEQNRALQGIVSISEDVLEKWTEPKDTQLILVGGAAGTGKSILLSTLFYELSLKLGHQPDYETDSSARVHLLVNNDDQMRVYDDMALKQGLQKKSGQCVSRPTAFINERSRSVGKSSFDYTQVTSDIADVVLVDEAHLLFTQKSQNGIESHLHEILRRAKIVIAVFDPEQIMQRKQWWHQDVLRELAEAPIIDLPSDERMSLTGASYLELTGHYSNARVNNGEVQVITDRYSVHQIELTEQFRIQANAETIKWIDSLVQPDESGEVPFPCVSIPADYSPAIQVEDEDARIQDEVKLGYRIRVCSSPNVLFDSIRLCGDDLLAAQNQMLKSTPKNKKKSKVAVRPRDLCRVVATFDWPYDPKNKKGSVALVKDVSGNWVIPEKENEHSTYDRGAEFFERPWNRAVNDDAPKVRHSTKEAWSSADFSRDEIGSYFTIQGFDLNYVGVIIGPSVRYENGHIIFDPGKSCDRGVSSDRIDLKGDEKLAAFKKACLRRQLGVLLKRGVHGLYLFAVDSALQNKLREAALENNCYLDKVRGLM